MKTILSVIRAIVGILFIFSGLVKANDPLGLSYKMQEFFGVWNFHLLDHLTLAFSILMIVFEIVAGVAVLLGWRMKLFSWLLLLLIIFFTFLTGYAYLTGKVRECGCFGDCIPLSAGESFAKDIILLVLILVLFALRSRIRPVASPTVSAALLTMTVVFSVAFQWFVLIHLPYVDCLPYKRGNDLVEKMQSPPGSVPDSTVITLVYNKNGKQLEFGAGAFPADFDSTYHFVNRYDKLVRKGNAEPPIHDFNLVTAGGTDTTQEVLAAKEYKLFLFLRELEEESPSWNKAFSIILTMTRAKRIPIYIITADFENVEAWTVRQGIANAVTVLKCDATAIKTAARANPTLYLIHGSTVKDKWSYADLDAALPSVNELGEQLAAPAQH
ncbi:MAG TPA: BT_3928 family protein [Puia sp.]|jgi:uncharacterized membrane protein YphA (DoxX/SURF4 family)|nr:BT_3928 family protein [Puia sp.]